jgi:hypothetical protein
VRQVGDKNVIKKSYTMMHGQPIIKLCWCCFLDASATQESNTSITRGCFLAGQFYPAGKSWHPYLPPNGFELCAVCTCDV